MANNRKAITEDTHALFVYGLIINGEAKQKSFISSLNKLQTINGRNIHIAHFQQIPRKYCTLLYWRNGFFAPFLSEDPKDTKDPLNLNTVIQQPIIVTENLYHNLTENNFCIHTTQYCNTHCDFYFSFYRRIFISTQSTFKM